MVKRFYLKLSTVLILFLSIVFFNDTGNCRNYPYKWMDDSGQIHITDSPPPEQETPLEPEKAQTTEPTGAKPSEAVKGSSAGQAAKETVKPESTPPSQPTPPPATVTRPQPTSAPKAEVPVVSASPAPAKTTAKTPPKEPPVASTKSAASPPPVSSVSTVASAPPVATPRPTTAVTPRKMPPTVKAKPGKGIEGIYNVEMLKNKLFEFLLYALIVLALIVVISVAFLFALYKTAKKLNVSSAWMAWVPLLNLFIMAQMAGRPVWWGVLLMVPVVGSVFFVILWMDICQRLGLKRQLGLLMLIPILVPIALSYLAPAIIMGISSVFTIPVAVLFFLSISTVFMLPFYYLRQAGRIPQQDTMDYDPYDQSTSPLDSLSDEENMPVFLQKTGHSDEDDTQGQGDYIHDETADINDVVPRSTGSDRVIPASDISFGREYIMDSSDEQIVDKGRDFESREKFTDEYKSGDTADAFSHSEDSTIVRDGLELRKKTEVEFEPVIEIGSDDDFRVEDGDMVIAQGDLGIDGVEEGYPSGEIEFGVEIPQESTSADSAWTLDDDSSIKPHEDEFKPDGQKEGSPLEGEIEFGIELLQESTSEDSTWVLGKGGSSKPHEDEFKSEGPKEEYIPEGEIEFAIELPQESTSEDSTWVLGKDGSSKPHEDEFKSEGPKEEYIPE
ncbi:MAG: hypothetical protein HQL04_02790, partial [Nitrospirae bacterium]|nr:hypothetical protein [Nitrospirota bacterium]